MVAKVLLLQKRLQPVLRIGRFWDGFRRDHARRGAILARPSRSGRFRDSKDVAYDAPPSQGLIAGGVNAKSRADGGR